VAEGHCEAPCVKFRSQNWDPTSWKSRPKSFQVSVLETASVKIQAPKLRSQVLKTMSWKPYPKISQVFLPGRPALPLPPCPVCPCTAQFLSTQTDRWVPVNCFNQLITHARSQDLGFRTSMWGFRTWISGPGFQALNARFQDLDLRTGFQALGIWLSGPGFEDLESSPSYGLLIIFPSLFSASTVTFLCVQWSQTDART